MRKIIEKGDVMKKNPFIPIYIIIVVIFVLSAAVSIYTIGREGSMSDRRVNVLLMARVYDVINNSISRAVIISDAMSHNIFLIEDLKSEENITENQFEENISKYLKSVKSDMNVATAFLISDKTKRYYTYKGLNKVMDIKNNVEDFWYPQFLNTEKKRGLNVAVAKQNNDAWTIFVNVRMEDSDGKLLGVVGVGLNMDEVQKTLLDYEQSYDVDIHLVNSDGLVMADVSNESIAKDRIEFPKAALESENGYYYEEGERGHFRIFKYLDELDWYLVIASKDDQDKYRGAFFYTVIKHILLCFVMLIVVFEAMNYAADSTRKLHEASFIDKPTGLYNKRSFEDLKEHLKASGKIPQNFIVITADLNGLKRVNDNLGHEAGDELIAGGASVLRTVAEKRYGAAYRTGGDEFMAILRMPLAELEDFKTELENAISNWHGKMVSTLSISYGFASSEENPDMDIESLIKLSDERMYVNKDEYYKKTGAKRRS